MPTKWVVGPVTGLYASIYMCLIQVGGIWLTSPAALAGPVFTLAADARRAGTGVVVQYFASNQQIVEIQSL